MTRSAAEIFHEAREMAPEKREGYLVGACGKDLALRSKVEALLKADAEAGNFMASPTAGAAAQPEAALSQEQPGGQIGRYKLLEQIGEGGMGTIWLAEQREPVKRRVALKIIKLGMDTKQVIARFEAERQALALMDHPNIAKVLDAGSTETGRPYFVMEYIRGVPILEYCDTARLDMRARLELFTSVCHAIQHAHQKGIIHRDIKPSNVLVTLHDGVPVPKVIDFGIAKATNSELTEKTLFTEHRQMIGTPAYMSPEQAEMSGLDIDTRSDIYSLGVLLYELLTGTTPFDAKALFESGYNEMLRAIREDEPHKPSTRVSSLGDTGTRTAQQRRVELKKLGLLLRGDLDWIVMKCLEKDRTRRYETANGLAADIGRHLDDQPVSAGAPSAGYKLRKFARRNRLQLIAAGSVLTALLLATVGTSWGLVEQSRARTAQVQRQLEDDQRTAAERARKLRNAEAVDAFLGQCEAALHAGDASKARLALDAAHTRFAEGGAEADAARLARLDADLTLATELDAIDQFRWLWSNDQFAPMKAVVPRMREALAKFGVALDVAAVESAAAAVNASTVRERIVAALDWVLWERRTRESTAGAHALLRRLDDDPFRNAIRDTFLGQGDPDQARFVELTNRPAALEQPPEFAAFLGDFNQVDERRRVELLQAAALRRPKNLVVLMTLGRLTFATPDPRDELRWCQSALAAAPANVAAYCNLGVALKTNGRLNEAIACDRRAIELDPRTAPAYLNLANALELSGQLEEALRNHRKAIELAPGEFENYCCLGNSLSKNGRLDEGIATLRKAIELNPKHAEAHYNLGYALQLQGKPTAALESFRQALELDPAYLEACINVGTLLRNQGKFSEAFGCFERAIAINPKSPIPLSNLGCVLADLGRYDEAIAACKQAIELDPTQAQAYYNLGSIYASQGSEDAIASFRKAIEVDPNYAEAHCNLAQALRNQGDLEEALAEYQRGHELGSARPIWNYPSADWIRETEAEIAKAARLQTRLSELRAGGQQPRDNAERLELALFCQNKKLYCDSVEFYGAALAADPKVGEEVDGRCVRYNAACVAILCADGKGGDARLRKQALEWLRADLGVATRRLAGGKQPADPWSRWFCNHSLRNGELLSIRDAAALAQLPADEQAAFEELWAQIAVLAQSALPPLPASSIPEVRTPKQDLAKRDTLDEAKRLNDLASAQLERKSLAESEATQRKSLAMFQRLVPGDHKDVALALQNLAIIVRENGRAAEAEPIETQSLEMFQRLQPQGGETVALALFTLGTIQEAAGHVPAAVQSYEAALEGNRRVRPAGHPDVLACMSSLARAYYFVGRSDKALTLYEDVLRVQETRLGRQHPETLVTIGNVGANYMVTGRAQEALPLLEEAWQHVQRYPQLRFIEGHLFKAYLAVGDLPKARAVLDDTLATYRATLAKGSAELAQKLTTTGMSLIDLEAWDSAEELLREALATREKLQPDAWTTFNTKSVLGEALLRQAKLAEAEPLLLDGYRGMKAREASIPSQGSVRIPEALERLVKLCEAKRDASGAARWRSELEASRAEGGKR